jgi:dihydrofolate reductase
LIKKKIIGVFFDLRVLKAEPILTTMISMIAAVAENNVIGKNNNLIWHISEDLQRFKKLTLGHPVIMGRQTYESLPVKPLPNRRNIVISRKSDLKPFGAETASSAEEAIKMCLEDEEVFVCGGAEIYRLFLPVVDKMYLTHIHKNFEGDTFFPEVDLDDWVITEDSELKSDDKSGLEYSFRNYLKL